MNRRDFISAASLLAVSPNLLAADATEKSAAKPKEPLIIQKPYAQLRGRDALGIVWMTRENATGFVEWTQDGGKIWTRSTTERDGLLVDNYDRIHKVVITGFDPTKPLRYRVQSKAFTQFGPYAVSYSGEEEVYEDNIRAIEPANGCISFAVINDVHNNLAVYTKFAPLLSGLSFVVFNGDITSHVDDEKVVRKSLLTPFADCTHAAQAPVWYLRGNHETRGAFARHLRDYVDLPQGHFYGATTLASTRFVFLDTGEDKPDTNREYSGLVNFDHYLATQTEWLKREVESEDWKSAARRIVFAHIPPTTYTSTRRPWKQPLKRVQALHAVLDNANTTLLIGAHLHERAINPDLHPYPLVVGGGPDLADKKEDARPTLTRCDLSKASLLVRQLSADGTELNRLEL